MPRVWYQSQFLFPNSVSVHVKKLVTATVASVDEGVVRCVWNKLDFRVDICCDKRLTRRTPETLSCKLLNTYFTIPCNCFGCINNTSVSAYFSCNCSVGILFETCCYTYAPGLAFCEDWRGKVGCYGLGTGFLNYFACGSLGGGQTLPCFAIPR